MEIRQWRSFTTNEKWHRQCPQYKELPRLPKIKRRFQSEASNLRHGTITLESWKNFPYDPESIKLLEPSWDIASNPLPRLSRSLGSASYQLTPVEYFKRSGKRDSSQFTNFKYWNHWDNWCPNTLATARAQDVDKLLYSDYVPLTQEDLNLFKEKRKFMCYVFSTVL